MKYFERRHIRKQLRQLLKEARHARNLREDIAPPGELRKLGEAERRTRAALAAADDKLLEPAGQGLADSIRELYPTRRFGALRENIEILIVAVVAAMAVRTYFIQPFKIPTSSMRPSLYGLHYEAKPDPGVCDYYPLKLVNWLLFGEWYSEVRARVSGKVRIESGSEGPVFIISGVAHPVPENMTSHVQTDDIVYTGQLLASGVHVAGDHIFVDKVSWNLRPPRRGEIMVFKTQGIDHPQIKKNEHYVKRMVGLPHDKLSILPPNLLINDQPVTAPEGIARIERRDPGYAGYQKIGGFLLGAGNAVKLGPDEYFACGDNQLNSMDSRYWGPVPRRNLIGPAFLVYWPLSKRWGMTR